MYSIILYSQPSTNSCFIAPQELLTQSTYICRIDWNHSMFNTSLFKNSTETEDKLRNLSHKRNDLIAVCSIVGKLADCDELMHPVETEIGRKYLKKLIIFKL